MRARLFLRCAMFSFRLRPDLKRLTGVDREARATVSAVTGDASPVLVEAPPYPQRQWDDDCFAAFGEGRDPAPCPDCGRTGFFGPRIDSADRRYRQCRFCGFTQGVGEQATRCVPIAHGCAPWPECARAPYLWWLPSDVVSFTCPYCCTQLSIEAVRRPTPETDPEHPWWRVPQHRSRFYYLRFWANWTATKGRAHL